MRMHPERAAEAQREVVIGAAARRNRRPGNTRHAVLPPRRRQPVPMDQARLVDAVFDPDAKGLADFGGEAERPVRLADAVDRGASCRSPRCRAAAISGSSGAARSAPGGERRRRRPRLRRRGLRAWTAWEASSMSGDGGREGTIRIAIARARRHRRLRAGRTMPSRMMAPHERASSGGPPPYAATEISGDSRNRRRPRAIDFMTFLTHL